MAQQELDAAKEAVKDAISALSNNKTLVRLKRRDAQVAPSSISEVDSENTVSVTPDLDQLLKKLDINHEDAISKINARMSTTADMLVSGSIVLLKAAQKLVVVRTTHIKNIKSNIDDNESYTQHHNTALSNVTRSSQSNLTTEHQMRTLREAKNAQLQKYGNTRTQLARCRQANVDYMSAYSEITNYDSQVSTSKNVANRSRNKAVTIYKQMKQTIVTIQRSIQKAKADYVKFYQDPSNNNIKGLLARKDIFDSEMRRINKSILQLDTPNQKFVY